MLSIAYSAKKIHDTVFLHHGDDFVIGGARERSALLIEVLRKVLIVEDRNVTGPETCDNKEMTCLKRWLRWCD